MRPEEVRQKCAVVAESCAGDRQRTAIEPEVLWRNVSIGMPIFQFECQAAALGRLPRPVELEYTSRRVPFAQIGIRRLTKRQLVKIEAKAFFRQAFFLLEITGGDVCGEA